MTSSHPTRAGKARDSKLVNEHHLLHLMLHLQTPLNQDTSSYKRSHRQDAGRKDADVSRKATAQDLDAKDRHPHVWSMARVMLVCFACPNLGDHRLEAEGQQHSKRRGRSSTQTLLKDTHFLWHQLSCKTAAACFHFCLTDKHRTETEAVEGMASSAPQMVWMGSRGTFEPISIQCHEC